MLFVDNPYFHIAAALLLAATAFYRRQPVTVGLWLCIAYFAGRALYEFNGFPLESVPIRIDLFLLLPLDIVFVALGLSTIFREEG